ncbi:hypothetical protein [Streptomyces sp. NBC_00887]|uniref:hypothetical protein n=1 Tax=Streptomyces sp. NBC_00887 TaxID=2975859 RepID=UPI003865BFE8|nr:hypothetical protein OG844_10985 [Streptomyces sp. NBC_00887]
MTEMLVMVPRFTMQCGARHRRRGPQRAAVAGPRRQGPARPQLRHLDTVYSETGWDQEGLDYFSYGLGAGGPGVTGSIDSGIGALKAKWQRPGFADLLLHSSSPQPDKARLQWGVGTSTGAPLPGLIFTQAPADQQAAWLWQYEKSGGGGGAYELLDYPYGVTPQDPDEAPAAVRQALLDDHGGSWDSPRRRQGHSAHRHRVGRRTHPGRHHLQPGQPTGLRPFAAVAEDARGGGDLPGPRRLFSERAHGERFAFHRCTPPHGRRQATRRRASGSRSAAASGEAVDENQHSRRHHQHVQPCGSS